MKRDAKTADEKRGKMRRSAKAHWLLASVTKRQSQLHRELALLLDKEAEAHLVLERWDRGTAAGGRPADGPAASGAEDATAQAGVVGAHPADISPGAPLEGADAGDPEAQLKAASGKSTDLRAAGVARVEARAHRDLALRADARTLWHKTVTALLLRSGMSGGSRVQPPVTADVEAGDEND